MATNDVNTNANTNTVGTSSNNVSGFKYVKMPRSVTEYTLMKGVTDFSNLKQFDLFESGYSFLTVVSVPKFMQVLANQDSNIRNLQNGFIHIMEGEFKGISGIPDITSETGEISNGVSSIQVINNVSMDTAIEVSMTFYERSGSLLTKYLNCYLTGIKDPYSKAKTYHGLVGGTINDPGPDWEVFTFLYYVTDNTMRRIEKAYLLANAQPSTAANGELYNSQKGSYEFKELDISFRCFPIMGDQVDLYANAMLRNDLTTEDASRKIVLNFNDYKWDVYSRKVGQPGVFPSAQYEGNAATQKLSKEALDGSNRIDKLISKNQTEAVSEYKANAGIIGTDDKVYKAPSNYGYNENPNQ